MLLNVQILEKRCSIIFYSLSFMKSMNEKTMIFLKLNSEKWLQTDEAKNLLT